MNKQLHNFAGLIEGDEFEIWYQKPDFFGHFSLTSKLPNEFDKNDLSKTHVLLGTLGGVRYSKTSEIRDTILEGIFTAMQGERWSPRGEANNFIRSKGLGHTSMCCGDIIVFKNPTREIYICDSDGWARP